MENKTYIYNFLESKNFRIISNQENLSFGDYFCIFSNDKINIRFLSDKGIEYVDIQSINDKDNWYDLALVEDFLKNIDILNHPTTIKNYISFLEKYFDNIVNLFSEINYPTTKKIIIQLQRKRAKQMFPGMVE